MRVFIHNEGALNSFDNIAKYAVPITHLDSIGYHNMEATQRQASDAAGSCSAAEAVRRRLHAFVETVEKP
jgi:hypothetical protein